jgi:preprotein translocase subunit YajC
VEIRLLSVLTHAAVLAADTKSKGSPLGLLVYLIPIAVIAVMFSRSNKRRQATAVEVRNAVVVGAEVLTASGQYGTVTDVIDGDIMLEIAPGVRVRYVQGAIARVINSPALPEVLEEPGGDAPLEG